MIRSSMVDFQLPFEPHTVFRGSSTPAGLYARQKWLNEASTRNWQRDFDAAVHQLYSGQSPDGLWNGSWVETIHRLFGLHLTVRQSNSRIEQGLTKLLTIVADGVREESNDEIDPKSLFGLPFAPGRMSDILATATMFLAVIFGKSSDEKVSELFERRVFETVVHPLAHRDASALHNLFRALVVHPEWAKRGETQLLLEWLANRQQSEGDWGAEIPFFQAFNALAHLKHPKADRQIENSLPRLVNSQNADGTWGREDREWHTFLVVHALRNKGLL
jgi:hypothetical protein